MANPPRAARQALRGQYGDDVLQVAAQTPTQSTPPTIPSQDFSPVFACPYLRYNPRRFESFKGCGKTGYTAIHRLKEHLDRAHRYPVCDDCDVSHLEFDKTAGTYLGSTECEASGVQARDYSDGFDEDQAEQLRKRWRGDTPEIKWAKMYRILFAVESKDPTPSPYFSSFNELELRIQALEAEIRRLEDIIQNLQRHFNLIVESGSNSNNLWPPRPAFFEGDQPVERFGENQALQSRTTHGTNTYDQDHTTVQPSLENGPRSIDFMTSRNEQYSNEIDFERLFFDDSVDLNGANSAI